MPCEFLTRLFTFSLGKEFSEPGKWLTVRNTGFEVISLQLNDHTDRCVGGRQYGTSEDLETLPRLEQYSGYAFRRHEGVSISIA